MARRGVVLHERARRLVAEQESSGLSVARFARERGLSAWTLYDWKRRSRDQLREVRAERSRFVEVKLGTAAEAPALVVETPRGLRVRVPRGFDEGELRRLIGALSSC